MMLAAAYQTEAPFSINSRNGSDGSRSGSNSSLSFHKRVKKRGTF